MRQLIGSDDTGNPYEWLWNLGDCGNYPEDNGFQVIAEAEDNCGRKGRGIVDGVVVTGRGCFRVASRAEEARAASWVSELGVAEARGQVVVDGGQAFFPGTGRSVQPLSLGPGPHRFEAVLVAGPGRPGLWRFDLSTLGVVPASVQVVAGEVAQVALDQVAFRLQGRPGERIVFTVRTGRE